jgi:cold shock CspA family protein
MVHCHDATASSFVTKGRGDVFAHFHAVTVKRHSSMQNSLLGLPGQILCEQFH